MKKVLAISILAAMLLAVGMSAMATETNWQLVLKASDLAGSNFNNTVSIGCTATFTDGKDTAKGEPGTLGSPTVGKIIASAAAVFPDNAIGARDFKQPITEAGSTAEKSWTIKLYTLANAPTASLNGFLIGVTLGTGTNNPVYVIGGKDYEYVFTASFIPGGEKIYNAASPMPTAFSWQVSQSAFDTSSDVATMTIVARPVGGTVITPEPSSMVALASGLFGLVGFGIRRRK